MIKRYLPLVVVAGLIQVTSACGEQIGRSDQASSAVGSAAAPVVGASGQERASYAAAETTIAVPVLCGAPGAENDLASLASGIANATLSSGGGEGLSLIATDAQGHTASLGCMSKHTADVSLNLGLSFGAVVKMGDRVIFALAAPSGRPLKERDWMRPISTTSSAAGFDVSVFELDVNRFGGELTPTEQQIQQLAAASADGTVSTGGFGPDLLAAL